MKKFKINNSKMMLLINYISFILLLFLDQITKIQATKLKNNEPVVLIKNVLEFRYLENHGAAFGILQGKQLFFLIIAAFVFVVINYLLLIIPQGKKYVLLNIIFSFILAGAIGNTIDRYTLGYVRDFIYFKLIDFPIFNVADIYITCTTILLIILVLFYYKEEDLEFLSFKDSKK